jgi:hypothetical protein
MFLVPHPIDRPSTRDTNVRSISAVECVADAVYSLLDTVDSEYIAEEFRIGLHNDKHDFESHVKIVVREGLVRPVYLPNSQTRPPLMTHSNTCPSHASPNSRTTVTTVRSFASCSRYSTRLNCTISVASSENGWSG